MRWMIVLGALWLGQGALAASWSETIKIVEARSQKLWDLAMDQHPGHLGTALNELDANRHQCTITGRLLDKTEHILELEKDEVPRIANNLSESEAYELKAYAHSLSNWAYIARRLVDMTEAQRVEIWNLQCAGKMGIPASAAIGGVNRAASFRVEGYRLHILGDFEPGLFEEFVAFYRQSSGVTTISLGSRGGSVSDAVDIARFVRAEGLETEVVAECSSACALAFLGGQHRYIMSPYPRLGYHQIALPDGTALPLDHPIYDQVKAFIAEMGADAAYVIGQMQSAAPSDMAFPDVHDLCGPRVVIWVQRSCSAN